MVYELKNDYSKKASISWKGSRTEKRSGISEGGKELVGNGVQKGLLDGIRPGVIKEVGMVVVEVLGE